MNTKQALCFAAVVGIYAIAVYHGGLLVAIGYLCGWGAEVCLRWRKS